MAKRDEVTALLESGHSYETAAVELGIAPGLVYMIANGLPADRSDSGAEQALVNPRAFNPTRKPHVLEWVAARAARELTPRRDPGAE
jgi:hypothetical protein